MITASYEPRGVDATHLAAVEPDEAACEPPEDRRAGDHATGGIRHV